MSQSRVPLIYLDTLSDEQRAAHEEYSTKSLRRGTMDPRTKLGALSEVLLHNPDVFRGHAAFSRSLAVGVALSPREAELVILRVAWRCRSAVEWSNHTVTAHTAGLSESDIDRITLGPDAEGWSGQERALLSMVDELHDSAMVSDDTWAQLAAHYSVEQLVALPLLVGHFHAVAYILNALIVPSPDPSRGGLAAR